MASTFPCLMPSCEELLERSHLSLRHPCNLVRELLWGASYLSFVQRLFSLAPRRPAHQVAAWPGCLHRCEQCPAPRCRTPMGGGTASARQEGVLLCCRGGGGGGRAGSKRVGISSGPKYLPLALNICPPGAGHSKDSRLTLTVNA